ncbi:DUF3263 domain-containing protein [Rhodococcus opacus]|uniref:DUF3263 domain-containing protein n=2 Tax=Rhodococcus opacus TaxID=37919 RepID=A0AAX3YPV4_RHOOP|nr:DUF3263 domain-containing protein [Rhodococcus opacus]MCZ4587609.1 DUF3263 domain-containing protein [Rhodococcus opacus]WLF51482.1 DUF3263 domain-containing protein [Rhodococcus opacus]
MPGDARFVDFALQWVSYGGGDEYILPEFGVQPSTYYRRLLSLLQSVEAPRLEPADRHRLVTMCLCKLGVPGPPIP